MTDMTDEMRISVIKFASEGLNLMCYLECQLKDLKADDDYLEAVFLEIEVIKNLCVILQKLYS